MPALVYFFCALTRLIIEFFSKQTSGCVINIFSFLDFANAILNDFDKPTSPTL